MIEADTAVYRKFSVQSLLSCVAELELTQGNQQRLNQLTLLAQAAAEKKG